MWKPHAFVRSLSLLHFLFHLHSVLPLVSAKGSNTTTWNTLSVPLLFIVEFEKSVFEYGNPPLVIARGGFSGLFPDSSSNAYKFAVQASFKNVILWCDVQLTKDAQGICIPNIKLENATDIDKIFENNRTNYIVNGVPTNGYFSVDYTLKKLRSNVMLIQGDFTRSSSFDNTVFEILTVDDVVTTAAPPGLWLNIQHDSFYTQHNLSMKSFVLSVFKTVNVSYISSPEAGFLRSIKADINPKITKLVFRFMGKDDVDPSTKQTYGSLLKNLTSIKTFASGILVPKDYIWPVDPISHYLHPHTSLVSDAHKVGLEVFASTFLNDIPISYDYSYDPVAEHLSFIDNGNFSVDGVLSDFPLTSSAAIDCFAHIDNAPKKVNTLVISKYGASGDYPPCTNLAYEKAISDGADVIDCPVQMSKDGIPFCLRSIDLRESTTVDQTIFSKLSKSIPEIKSDEGIYTFDLEWNNITSLTPTMLNLFNNFQLYRNPRYNRNVSLLTLSEFLNLTKGHTSLSGVVIIIENAPYLARNQNLSVIDAVIDTLSKGGYDKLGTPNVMIQSTDSSVLLKFKEKTKYELVYTIDEVVSDVVDSAISDIKSFAHAVLLKKVCVYPNNEEFLLTGSTKIVPKFKSSNLSVYVRTFHNEFVSQAYDFLSDATVEINTFVQGAGIDGVITDFPQTANRYRRNRCLNLGNSTPPYMKPIEVGGLLQLVDKSSLPPAMAPAPTLTEADVTEPPLPPFSKIAPSSPFAGAGPGPEAQPPQNAQAKVDVCFFMSSLTVLVASLLL
ncbi:unnamed protein product [Sphenostylis stenocarpa]|uniref:glycerophosphodiester phosphodiesterase n=1 Tax=Sphenostylis stenocarpa TaxID=92480 RepID=A0AA86VPN2_9FABA|nr:unnamed protein product [Sphenostylis stenocarpa]